MNMRIPAIVFLIFASICLGTSPARTSPLWSAHWERVTLAAGQDLLLASRAEERGTFRLINIALAGEGPDVDRSSLFFLIDGEQVPSVRLPLGLSGTYGASRFHSRFVSCSSSIGLLGCTLALPVPYRHDIKIFLHNGGKHSFKLWGWLQGDTGTREALSEKLHSANGGDQYERQIMVRPYQEITLLDVDGPGRLAGLQFFMDRHNNRINTNENCIEGNFRYYFDGSEQAQYESSGTEDYFGSSFNFQDAPFASDNFGVFFNRFAGFSGPSAPDDQVSAWRWHYDDPVRFDRHLKITWQCGDKGGPEVPISSAGIAWSVYYYSLSH